MHYKNNIKNLIKLREDLLKYENKEKKDISEILSWRKKLLKKSKINCNAKILICGLTYKPEVADLRNSLAYSIFIKIKKKFKNSSGFDPLIHNTETKKFLILNKINNFKKYKAIIFITKHKILYKIYKKLIINKKNIILNCML